jgi:hypothetical protein
MAVRVEVAPILGIKKMGAARMPTPNTPPKYRYHSDRRGSRRRSAVLGKVVIKITNTAILTRVRTKTDPKFPTRLPRVEFNTLWVVINDPASIPIPNSSAYLVGSTKNLQGEWWTRQDDIVSDEQLRAGILAICLFK